jgi:hypothetical protein
MTKRKVGQINYDQIYDALNARFSVMSPVRIIVQNGVPMQPMPNRLHDMRPPDGIQRPPNPELERKPEPRKGTPWARSSKALKICQSNPDRSGTHGWRKNGVEKATGKLRKKCRFCKCTGYEL